MWPFKKHIDPVIAVLYQRLYQIERYMATDILKRIDELDKRVKDLEKILKSCNITVTVIDKD